MHLYAIEHGVGRGPTVEGMGRVETLILPAEIAVNVAVMTQGQDGTGVMRVVLKLKKVCVVGNENNWLTRFIVQSVAPIKKTGFLPHAIFS